MADAILIRGSAFFFSWENGSVIWLNGKRHRKTSFCSVLGPIEANGFFRLETNAKKRFFNPFRRLRFVQWFPQTFGTQLTEREMALVHAEPRDSEFNADSERIWHELRSAHLDFLLSKMQFEDYVESRPIRTFLARVWAEANQTAAVKSFRRFFSRHIKAE